MPRKKRATQPAAYAPVGDAAIVARTGRTWAEWIATLDGEGARDLSHGRIAEIVHSRFGVDGWWSQSVTVGYERMTGRRANLQKADGYAASGSLTVQTGVERLYSAAADAKQHRKWLPPGVTVHKSTRPKSMRATAKDGTKSISLYFYAKGPRKAQVTVQQEKLASQDAALKLKKVWAKSLRALAEMAATD